MHDHFKISSNLSDSKLIFSDYDGEDFKVRLEGITTTSLTVYGYAPHAQKLSEWFEALGSMKDPWLNELRWTSLEMEFEITATCSALGEVCFGVHLSLGVGSAEETTIKTIIVSELGQLGRMSKKAKLFFEK